jgi:hypothetical protein
MKIKYPFSILILSSCLILPQKYINEDVIKNEKFNFKIEFNEIENKKLFNNLNNCKLFLETSKDIQNKFEINKTKLQNIKFGVNKFYMSVQSQNENDKIYFIDLSEIYCNDQFIIEDRKSEVLAQNLLAFSLLGIIPIITEHDYIFEIEIKDLENQVVDKFYTVYNQKSVFSIFLAPFIFIELNEKRRNKIIEGISEKIFIDIYFRLNRHSKIK